MKYRICISALLLWAGMQVSASNNQKEVVIKIIETSDVHGNFFPYNFIERKEWSGSLARVHSFVKEQREKYGDNCLLMDNGDILQGQPTAYYYNFMDTVSTHVAADMMNYMGCVVGNMGNHDVETGHAVYDRWIKQCDFPVLGANIIDNATGKPYLKPYEVLERDGVRIAVLGMITPAIPSWLPEKLWSGLHFEEMEPCARKWVKIIKEKENPDVIVGLFHAGKSGNVLGQVVEDASMDVAKRVPGFDVVLEEGENLADVTARIKADDYFAHDPLDVRQCRDREELAFVADQSHGVLMERTGASGMTDNQILKFDMRINNPALTAQVLVSCALATTRLQAGCHTLIEVPPIAMLRGERMDIISRMV